MKKIECNENNKKNLTLMMNLIVEYNKKNILLPFKEIVFGNYFQMSKAMVADTCSKTCRTTSHQFHKTYQSWMGVENLNSRLLF